jgi:hypothetical protein
MKLPFLSKLRKTMSSRPETVRKSRARHVTGRTAATEALLFKLARKLRNRAEAHAVQYPKPEDVRARAALLNIAANVEKAAGEMREPELPLA